MSQGPCNGSGSGVGGCGWAPWEPDSCLAALGSARDTPAFPERDLPEPLDQKMVVWEAVQKENYLSKLEKQRRDSDGEVLRRTAHRCAPPRASAARCGRPPPRQDPTWGN